MTNTKFKSTEIAVNEPKDVDFILEKAKSNRKVG